MSSVQRFHAIEPVNDYRGAGTTEADFSHLIIFAAAYTAYAIACVIYECREARVQQDCLPLVGKSRTAKWDIIKLVLLGAVIILHTDQAVYGLGPHNLHQYHYLMRYNLGAFALSGFSFVSGVFGANSTCQSLKKTTCILLGAAVFTSVLCDLIILVTPGDKRPLYIHDMAWYLLALCVWRWTVSPFFYHMEQWSTPSVISWLFVFCACYGLSHGISFHSNFYWGYFAFWFYTPFFALGRCMPREAWTKLLGNKYLVCAAAGSMLLWCFALIWWKDVQEWNDVACLGSDCAHKAWPGPKSPEGLHTAGFLEFCRIFFLKAWISFSVVWLIAAATPTQHASASFFAGCGSRTIYGYVLHIVAHVYLGVRLGLPLIVDWLPEWMGLLLILVMCVLALFIWCSQWSQYLFSWMVEPLWILKCLPWEDADESAFLRSA